MKKLHILLLSAIMALPLNANFDVECSDGFKATLDGKNVLPQAGVAFNVGVPALYSIVGLIAGAIGGTCFAPIDPNSAGQIVGGGALIGAAGGLYAGVCEVNAYSDVYNASKEHLDLHGAAAQNDVKTIQALFKYKNGWYLFKGNIGKPENLDGNGRTALHYAGAFNAPEAVREILAQAPEEIQKEKVIGRSTMKKDDVYTAGVHGSSTATVAGALGFNGRGSAGASASRTRQNYGEVKTGGTERTENTVVENIPYVNVQDRAGNTAGHYAALTRSLAALKALLVNGADTSIPNRNQRTVEAICHDDSALIDALNQAQGKSKK
jgi:hypothetical protein